MYMFLFALDMYVYLHLFFCIYISVYTVRLYIFWNFCIYIYIVHLLSIHVGCKVQYFTESAQVLKEFPNWNHFFGSCAFLRTKALSLGSLIIGRRGLVFLPGHTRADVWWLWCIQCHEGYKKVWDLKRFHQSYWSLDMSQVTLFIWTVVIMDV